MNSEAGQRATQGAELLGRALREQRLARGWTVRDLAERSTLSFDTIISVERGRRLPSLKSLDAFATVFDVTVRDLLEGIYPWDGGQPPPD